MCVCVCVYTYTYIDGSHSILHGASSTNFHSQKSSRGRRNERNECLPRDQLGLRNLVTDYGRNTVGRDTVGRVKAGFL